MSPGEFMKWRALLFCILSLLCTTSLTAKHRKKAPVFFYVVIPSYNNEKWCLKNIESVINQDYPHWKAIYINDLSSDRTGNIIEEYLNKHSHLRQKFEVVHNWERKGMLANIYNAVQKAKNNWVVVTVDGDDTLKGKDVFSHLADIYDKNSNVWMTYGNWEADPPGKLQSDNEHIPDYIVLSNRFRQYKFCTTQLRTFYAGLFKKIKKSDFQHKGKFFMAAGDVAFMIPLLELSARGHIHFVEKVIYTYNLHNPINDFKVNGGLQGWCSTQIGKKKPYTPLKKASFLK
jgi:glycosyltransferase involved in cell wall biosynthesis